MLLVWMSELVYLGSRIGADEMRTSSWLRQGTDEAIRQPSENPILGIARKTKSKTNSKHW